jgi:hypothetical protein
MFDMKSKTKERIRRQTVLVKEMMAMPKKPRKAKYPK